MARQEDVEALVRLPKDEFLYIMRTRDEALAEVARLSGERDALQMELAAERTLRQSEGGKAQEKIDALRAGEAAADRAVGKRERLREALEDTDIWLDSLIKSGWAAAFIEGARTRQRLNRAALSAGAEQHRIAREGTWYDVDQPMGWLVECSCGEKFDHVAPEGARAAWELHLSAGAEQEWQIDGGLNPRYSVGAEQEGER